MEINPKEDLMTQRESARRLIETKEEIQGVWIGKDASLKYDNTTSFHYTLVSHVQQEVWLQLLFQNTTVFEGGKLKITGFQNDLFKGRNTGLGMIPCVVDGKIPRLVRHQAIVLHLETVTKIVQDYSFKAFVLSFVTGFWT